MKEVIVELFWILLALALLVIVILRANQGGIAWYKMYKKGF
jgi:hypothetical protein